MFDSASIDLSEYLTDVQINGSSIVTDGVANIPVVTSRDMVGAFRTKDPSFYITNGDIRIDRPSDNYIQGGIDTTRVPTIAQQHKVVFYGLAKAAGHDEKNSTLSVGQYTNEAKSAIQDMLDVPSKNDIPVVNVDDVQINGASIVSDGVANVPVASNSVLGAVRSRVGDNGIQILGSGYLGTYVASDSDVKNGIHSYRPISPNREHSATFYGLAKSAGADEKDSTLTVGNYTDNAKDKIQTMLGVSPLIAPHESDPFESNHVIGELFIINGKLYRAKTALAVGEYINEGTNVEVVDVAEVLDGKVGDVQINGTSIVTDGVANVPIAGSSAGVVKIDSNNGVTIGADGKLYISSAIDLQVKRGEGGYRPITPPLQHKSVFYGLAKASGDTTQSQSDNAVGIYTDEAKASIQSMLGVPSEDDVVTDVQINGTSIIDNGVANIPYAAYNKVGVVQVNASRGTAMSGSTLSTFPVDSATAKAGVQAYQPITPAHQHESVFYGLAKAAGDSTQVSSENEVGTYTDNAKSSIQTMLGLDDVVRDTDYATYSAAGVVKVDSDWGIGMYDPAWSGGDYGNFLYISPASSAQIKAGSTSYKAIVPSTQHESTFYGLAKASGDTTQTSSSNEIGIYTDEAKTAIKQMLGVHDTIDSFVEDVTGTDVTITGQPSYRYNCGELYSLTVTPPTSGTIDFRFTSGSTPTVLTLPQTVKMPEWWIEVEANTIYEMCITDGVYCGVMSWAM